MIVEIVDRHIAGNITDGAVETVYTTFSILHNGSKDIDAKINEMLPDLL